MDISFVNDFVSPLVLVVCLCTGYIVKRWIPADAVNRYIPAIVGVEGVLVTAWVSGALAPETLAVGLVSGLASTGLYEAFKHLIGRDETE